MKELRSGFFDTAAVMASVDKGRRKVLSKMGAYIRTRARSSIRSRKAVSAPGSPPSSHVGTLKKLLYFAYDLQTQSVVVGPVAFGKGEAPGLLEYGGTTTQRRKTGAGRTVKYKARPFIKPAGDAEAPKFKQLLKDMVK